jgi:uncharacterized membrane protein YkoI
MTKRTKVLALGAAAVALAAGGGVAAATSGGDDDGTDTPIKGSDLSKARAAALQATGGGTVTATETGDEESYYEVEVVLDDGSQVDVQLDRDFNVVGQDGDSESEAGDEAGE